MTGLVWEVKTTFGLQNNIFTYTYYNSSGINDGGDWGIGDTGIDTTKPAMKHLRETMRVLITVRIIPDMILKNMWRM